MKDEKDIKDEIDINKNIGESVKKYRKKNNLTQSEFGKLIGVNKQSVSKWENGTLRPSIYHLYKISNIIDIKPEFLLYGEDNKKDDDDEKLYVYTKKIERYVGLNSVYEHINDFNSFYKFVNMLSSAYQLLEPDTLNIGFILFDITYDDLTSNDMIVKNTHLIYSIFCYNDSVFVESSVTTLAFTSEDVSRIERAGCFNNEQYAITIHMKDDPNRFCQLLLGFNNSIEE